VPLAAHAVSRGLSKDTIAGFVHDPLSGAAERFLIPAALSLVKGPRSKKGQG
jgi:hypothetical protein